MTETVLDLATYTINTAVSEEEKGRLLYQISNKKTGVIEMETSLLPNAVRYAKELEEFAEEFYADEKPVLTLAKH